MRSILRTPVFYLFVLAALIGAFTPEHANAQSACGLLGVDCHQTSNSIDIAPATPAPSSTITQHVSVPKVDTNAVFRQQIADTLANAFIQLLFASDNRAEAQKLRMMEELKAKQAAAAKQNQIEEAARIEAMCQRLSTKLKLSGSPKLQLKNSGPVASLRLKLGENPTSGTGRATHSVVVYKNDGSVYTTVNGVAVPSAPSDGNTIQPSPEAASAATAPPQSGTAATPDASVTTTNPAAPLDPRQMSPQQLADAAAAFDSLPPEEQQRLIDQAQQQAQLAAGAGPSSSSALGQLQKIETTSKEAAAAPKLENAAAKAGMGFDQAGGTAASPAPAAISGSKVAQLSAHPSQQTTAAASNVSATASTQVSAPVAALTGSPTQFFGSMPTAPAQLSTPLASARPVAPASNQNGVPCPSGVEKLVPIREQLETELVTRRMQLENLQRSISRLNHTMQLDQQQYAEWEAEAEAGYKRCVDELWDLPKQLLMNHFIDTKESEFETIGEKNFTPAQLQQYRWLMRAKELKSFDDFKKWALEDEESRRVFFRDGLRTALDAMPLKSGPASLLSTLEALMDNTYDFVDLASTWDRIQQLEHNSDSFLNLVHHNGEQIKQLVSRINQIEAQLKTTPSTPPGESMCYQDPRIAAAK